MKKSVSFFASVAVGFLGVIFLGAQVQGAVLYEQDFAVTTTAPDATIGFFNYHGPTATPYTTSAISLSAAAQSLAYGSGNTNIGSQALLVESSVISSSNIGINQVTSISFQMESSVSDQNLQLAVEVGSTWYLATTLFNPSIVAPATFTAGDFSLETLNLSSASYDVLNFTANSTLSVGAATTLPTSGTITGIGLFNGDYDINGDQFINTLVVNGVAVPEPSVAVLAILGGGVLLGFNLRRRSMLALVLKD